LTDEAARQVAHASLRAEPEDDSRIPYRAQASASATRPASSSCRPAASASASTVSAESPYHLVRSSQAAADSCTEAGATISGST
jgi:hypothetical protein